MFYIAVGVPLLSTVGGINIAGMAVGPFCVHIYNKLGTVHYLKHMLTDTSRPSPGLCYQIATSASVSVSVMLGDILYKVLLNGKY